MARKLPAKLKWDLVRACRAGDLRAVQRLVDEKGAPVEPQPAQPRDSSRPLCTALADGHLTVARYLLKKGADVRGRLGDEPLHIASRRGDVPAMKLLIAAGVDPQRGWFNAGTSLQVAARAGRAAAVRFLLSRKLDPNLTRGDELSPLAGAAMKGHTAVVRILLAAGAKPLARRGEALDYAVEYGQLETARLLYAGGDRNVTGFRRDRRTLLHAASDGGHVEIARWLLSLGADRDRVARDYHEHAPLWGAAIRGHLDVAKLLLAGPISEKHREEALHAALPSPGIKDDPDDPERQRRQEIAKLLLAFGTPTDSPLIKRAIMRARRCGFLERA